MMIYITFKGGNYPLTDLTAIIKHEFWLPSWFRWDYYNVVLNVTIKGIDMTNDYFIKDKIQLEELSGKTIKEAFLTDLNNKLVLEFDNDTKAVFSIVDYGADKELELIEGDL